MGTAYTSQSASGYSASPPADDGSVTAANKIKYSTLKTQLGDPVKALADAINTALRTSLNVTPTTQSTAYTTTTADHLRPIEVTGTTTISLGDAATMVAQTMGYEVPIINTGVLIVTVALITAANTINGSANGTVKLLPGQSARFAVNSTNNGYDIVAMASRDPIPLTGVAGTNTITAGCDSLMTALAANQIFLLTPANTTTGATTLNITPSGGTALTAKNVFSDGAACVGGELKASVPALLQYDGTQYNILGRRFFKQPTRQVLTSGTGATYTTPSGCTRINVRLVGGGGGGGGATANSGSSGTDTTFSTLTGSAGAGGAPNGAGNGGSGGAASGGDINIRGGSGAPGQVNVASQTGGGSTGGNSAFGGGGGGIINTTGQAGATNSGAGGQGAIVSAGTNSGGGGGAGGYVEKLITAPAATYTYTVGASGAGGAAGTAAGGAGGTGIIIVDEWYE